MIKAMSNQNPMSPLRRTSLSSLVDAANKAQATNSKPVTRTSLRTIYMVVALLSFALLVGGFFSGLATPVVFGVIMIFAGVTLGWTQMTVIMNGTIEYVVDPTTGLRVPAPRMMTRAGRFVSAILFIGLAILGALVCFGQLISIRYLIIGILASVVIIAILGFVIAPWWITLVADLGAQRAQTAQETLRADIASQLHDSVLQTLAMIQMQSNDSAKVSALARSEERNLREWLYGDPQAVSPQHQAAQQPLQQSLSQSSQQMQQQPKSAEPMTFSATLKRVAAEVEDKYEVPIDVVAVGECSYSDELHNILDAAREAMSNAVRHGKPPVSVYMEVNGTQLQIFVRDHGAGFDATAEYAGHLGLKESILGRMRRTGGVANVVSRPGWGTEVRLSVRLQQRR